MTERVTHRSIQEASLARLQGNLQAMSLLQTQASSGKKITKPSDDPSGTVSSLALRQQLRLNEQYTVQGDDGLSWLNLQDTALQSTSSQLRTARTLLVQAMNQGTATDGTQTAISVEIDGILKTVVSLANTQYQGRSVFAGTSGPGLAVTQTQPSEKIAVGPPAVTAYTPAQYTWAETSATATVDTEVLRRVDAQSDVRVDSNGAKVFGADLPGNGVTPAPGDRSVFSVLQQISDEIKTPGSTGPVVDPTKHQSKLAELLDKLDAATGTLLEGLADVGARTNRIEQAKAVASSAKYELTDQLSKVEDVDLPAVLIQLSLQETAYKAALTANSKVLNTSLMDFLR